LVLTAQELEGLADRIAIREKWGWPELTTRAKRKMALGRSHTRSGWIRTLFCFSPTV
jgi:hypothetical protein